jgi:hypothetical protein
MTTTQIDASDDGAHFDTLRALIHEFGLRDAQRVARGIARGLDALRALSR